MLFCHLAIYFNIVFLNEHLNFLSERWKHTYYGPFHKYPFTNRPLHTCMCLFGDTEEILPMWITSWLSDVKMKLLKIKGKIKNCLLHCTFGRLQKLVQILIFAFWYFCRLIGKLIGILPWVSLFAIGHMEKTSLEHMFSRIMKYFGNTENMDNTFNSHLLTI